MRASEARSLPGATPPITSRSKIIAFAAPQKPRTHLTPSQRDEKTEKMLTGTAETIELAALALAVGGHAAAYYSASSTATTQPAKALKATTAVSAPEPTQNYVPPFPGGIIWLTAPLVVAAFCRRVSSSIAQRRVAGTPAAQALSRLSATENSLATQQESMTTMARHLDKLQTRTRIVSRDVRSAIKALDAGADDQMELLRGAALRLDKVESDVRDLEGLVEAVQVVSGKQFDILAAVVTTQQQQRAGGKVGGNVGIKKAVGSETVTPKMNNSAGKGSSSRVSTSSQSTAASVAKPPAPAAKARTAPVDNDSILDEWGRAVTGASGGASGGGDGIYL